MKLSDVKGLSKQDQEMVKNIEALMGPEPEEMGFVKNLFWGRIRQDLLFPYPEQDYEEDQACEFILDKLETYLKKEHPAREIDEKQAIPKKAIKKLFDLGVMGLTIPKQYGGQGLGITSYNRVLEMIGRYCGSTAVMVSAHQSIGCKAIMLFGTDAQKKMWLPKLSSKMLSAFCLSEPNVGSDAAGQETTYTKDGDNYILNGEKKWATSGALSGLFTVIAKNEKSGKISAFICTPDLEGIDIFEQNRSKCGIRGTWQARIRFSNVTVPKENLLHHEGEGLHIALTCLNYGRCTLSAGILGAAQFCKEKSTEWAKKRKQFNRPLADFELVKEKIARMSAYTYAMDAMLYMTTGMLDRDDKDIMVETAVCKVFCSDLGWEVINEAMQIMGGEGYMTENDVERAFRDNRIHLIVEGSNDVMRPFIFGYGGKKLAEFYLGIKNAVSWRSDESLTANFNRILVQLINPKFIFKAICVGLDMFCGIKKRRPKLKDLHPTIAYFKDGYEQQVWELNQSYKKMSRRYQGSIVKHQAVQSRLADVAIWLHAMACVLSKLNQLLNTPGRSPRKTRELWSGVHFLEIGQRKIKTLFLELDDNSDKSMNLAAKSVLA